PAHPLYDPAYLEEDFEGYRVYRSTSGLPGSFELLASWDKSSATPRHVRIQQVAGSPFQGTVTYDEFWTENWFLAVYGTELFTGQEYLVQLKADGSFFVSNLTLGTDVPASEVQEHWYEVGEPPYVFEMFSWDFNPYFEDSLPTSRSTTERIADGTYDDYFDDCWLMVGGMAINFKGDDPSYVPAEDIIFKITGYLEEPEGDNTALGYAYVDTGLINGMTYWYDVTAYDFQPFSSPHSLENGIRGIAVTPRSHATGIVEGSAYEIQHTSASGFLSDGTVIITVVEPLVLTGHNYNVVFEGDYWHLIDVTDNDTVLKNQTNISGDDNYPVVDGMVVKVMGPPIAFNDDLTELSSEGLSWLFNEAYMGGRNAVNNGNYRNFLLKFVAGPGDTTAEGLYQDDQGNTPMGIFLADPTLASVPFELWDLGMILDDPADDVRLWPLMYDFYDATFHTDNYFLILDKNNQGNTYAEDFFSNPDHDPASAYWGFDTGDPFSRYDWDYRFAFSETDPVWEKGDSVLMITNKPNTSDDVFAFKTNKPYISTDLVNLDDIRVVPNPYIVRNNWEPSRDYSRLAFTRLPDKCTIRIYTMAGDLIRTLRHDSAEFDGNENWDLMNKNNQKIAAGIYIYHVESDYGEIIGKFAVIR
ncbi:MAG: hypothetical protein AMJ90_09860, partial [candidate division Zixibacteria bacterium SM23_73_2]